MGGRQPTEVIYQTLTEHLSRDRDTALGRLVFYGYELPEYLAMVEVVGAHFSPEPRSVSEEVLDYLKRHSIASGATLRPRALYRALSGLCSWVLSTVLSLGRSCSTTLRKADPGTALGAYLNTQNVSVRRNDAYSSIRYDSGDVVRVRSAR